MGWARISDGMHDSPDWLGVSLPAVGLWTVCLTWAHEWRHEALTTGFVPRNFAHMFARRRTNALARELVEAGLWITSDGGRGWYITNFAEHIGGSTQSEDAIRNSIRARDRRMFRDAVFERDDYICLMCGAQDDLTLDHIVPLVVDTFTPRALADFATLCRPCNSRKGATVG